ncbi:hypothetical protein AB0368_00690 [Actinoplanes sp. NPDC051475]|uniref:hypothetical protein n=1 Tax=Actinoplanes sp. NPDC051475 TaxID=3157225 RepID=UPI00344BF7CB
MNFGTDGEPHPAPYCTPDGTILTCDLGTRSNWALGLPNMVVEAKPGAEIGRSGKLTMTVTGDGIEPLVATPTVTVAEDVDLAVSVGDTKTGGHPGDAVAPPIMVTNTGTKPVSGAAFRLVGYGGLKSRDTFTNCGHERDDDQELFCRFDGELAPGATYVLSAAPLAVRDDADPSKDGSFSVMPFTGDDFDEAGTFPPLIKGTSDELKLVPRAAARRALTTDSNRANNLAFGRVDILGAPGGNPSPSTSASSTPAATPSASATTTAPGTGTGTGTGTGSGLPITGLPIGAIAAVGAAMLLLGGLSLALTRRRDGRSTT